MPDPETRGAWSTYSCDVEAGNGVDGRVSVRETGDGAICVEVGPCGGRAVHARRTKDAWAASESLAELAPLGPARVSPSWVAGLCTQDGWLEPLASPLTDVLRLPSCHRTMLRPGHAAAFEALPLSTRAPEGDLRALLEGALSRYARGPLAVATGGLYSSCILALAHRVRGDTMCVSIALGGDDDDRPYVESTCRHLGITPDFVGVEEALRALPADLTVDGAPLAWPGALLEIAAMRRARERGAIAVLSGAGGDDMFDEDRAVAARVLEAGRVKEALAIALPRGAPLSALGRRLLRPLLRRRVPFALRSLSMSLRAGRSSSLPELFGPLARAAHEECWLRQSQDREFFDHDADERVLLSFRSRQFDALAFHRRLSEAAAGLPRLDPFLEPDVTAFAMRAEPWEHFERDLPRGLLRRAAGSELPDDVYRRTSRASIDAACATIAQRTGPALERLADVSALADLRIVEPRAFRPAFDAWRSGSRDGHDGLPYVWPVLAAEAWLRGTHDLPRRFEGA